MFNPLKSKWATFTEYIIKNAWILTFVFIRILLQPRNVMGMVGFIWRGEVRMIRKLTVCSSNPYSRHI